MGRDSGSMAMNVRVISCPFDINSAVSSEWVSSTVLKGAHHLSSETDLLVYSDTFTLG